MMFVFFCLAYLKLNMIISRPIHVAANGIISILFLSGYYSIVYVYTSSLSIHSSMDT